MPANDNRSGNGDDTGTNGRGSDLHTSPIGAPSPSDAGRAASPGSPGTIELPPGGPSDADRRARVADLQKDAVGALLGDVLEGPALEAHMVATALNPAVGLPPDQPATKLNMVKRIPKMQTQTVRALVEKRMSGSCAEFLMHEIFPNAMERIDKAVRNRHFDNGEDFPDPVDRFLPGIRLIDRTIKGTALDTLQIRNALIRRTVRLANGIDFDAIEAPDEREAAMIDAGRQAIASFLELHGAGMEALAPRNGTTQGQAVANDGGGEAASMFKLDRRLAELIAAAEPVERTIRTDLGNQGVDQSGNNVDFADPRRPAKFDPIVNGLEPNSSGDPSGDDSGVEQVAQTGATFHRANEKDSLEFHAQSRPIRDDPSQNGQVPDNALGDNDDLARPPSDERQRVAPDPFLEPRQDPTSQSEIGDTMLDTLRDSQAPDVLRDGEGLLDRPVREPEPLYDPSSHPDVANLSGRDRVLAELMLDGVSAQFLLQAVQAQLTGGNPRLGPNDALAADIIRIYGQRFAFLPGRMGERTFGEEIEISLRHLYDIRLGYLEEEEKDEDEDLVVRFSRFMNRLFERLDPVLPSGPPNPNTALLPTFVQTPSGQAAVDKANAALAEMGEPSLSVEETQNFMRGWTAAQGLLKQNIDAAQAFDFAISHVQ